MSNFKCLECGWQTEDPFQLHEVRDHDQRVMPGEFEPAGECPECGALIDCPDSDIEDQTLRYAAKVMRDRGWTVIEPSREGD